MPENTFVKTYKLGAQMTEKKLQIVQFEMRKKNTFLLLFGYP